MKIQGGAMRTVIAGAGPTGLLLAGDLAAAGVDVTRIQANGRGADNPLAPNTTLASRVKNRRTEITLTTQ
jgi:outer membrane protein OmpA-like peptidoglycan-associated protein